jgi:hypothetical protein
MAEVESAFANCTTWTDPDGVEYTIEPLDVPELGEQGVARRVTAAQNGFTLIIEVVYTRDRNYVLAFAHYGVDEIDSALTVELVSTLMERIAALESLE